MFIAVRDLRFARGRFALLGGVIALMTLMVVLLSGLTAGLGAASISAVQALPAEHLSFQQPAGGQQVSFTTSSLPAGTARTVAQQPGVTGAHALGVSTTRMRDGDASAALTVLGTDPALYPDRQAGHAPGAGEVAVTADLADDQSLSVGDHIKLAGQPVTVAEIVATTSFNHLPVAYTPIGTWQKLSHSDTVTAVASDGGTVAAIDKAAGTSTLDRSAAYSAVGAYSSEQNSLNLMRGLLLIVSALVVGAFFTVWTMQRAGDLAVVRAIGGSRGYLLRDALAQAGLVLLGGAAVGGGVAAGLGALATQVMPFVLDLRTVGVPLAAMIGVGILGAAASVRRVSTVDPLTALGAAR